MTTLTTAATTGRLLHRPVATGPAYWAPELQRFMAERAGARRTLEIPGASAI